MNKINELSIGGTLYKIDGIIPVDINDIDNMCLSSDQGIYEVTLNDAAIGILFITNITNPQTESPSEVVQTFLSPYRLENIPVGYGVAANNPTLDNNIIIQKRHFVNLAWTSWLTDNVLENIEEIQGDIISVVSLIEGIDSDIATILNNIQSILNSIDGYYYGQTFVPGLTKTVTVTGNIIYPDLDGNVNLTGIIKDGKSAYEVWLDQEENVGKSLDDFWRYLTADKGYKKIPIVSLSERPNPEEADLNAIYVYPDPNDETKSITAVSNGLRWIELFKSDGNITQMGEDISKLKKEVEKIEFFVQEYNDEFGVGSVPTNINNPTSFGFGGETGDILLVVTTHTGYTNGPLYLTVYGKPNINEPWEIVDGANWWTYNANRAAILVKDYVELGFVMGSTVNTATVRATVINDKPSLSDILAKVDGYFICDSSSETNKTINSPWYRLRNGGMVVIYFTNANTKPAPVTLNINSSGAKSIYINGKQVGLENTWKKGSVCLCWYDANEQHYNLKVLYDDEGDLSESIDVLGNSYLNLSDWEDISNSLNLTSGFKYAVHSTSGYAVGYSVENSGYSYTEPIHLSKGEAIRVKSYGNLFCPIQESDENGNILARLVIATNSTDTYRTFTYIATREIYIVVNVRVHNSYPYKIEKGKGLHEVDFQKISLIDELWLNSIDWGKDLADNTEVVSEYYEGKYRPSTGIGGYALDESSTYVYSSPILILKGHAVKVRCYGNYLIPLMECDDSGNVLSVLFSYTNSDVNKYVEYAFIANRDMYVKICGRKQDSSYPSSIYIGNSLMSFDVIREAINTVYDDVAPYRVPILTEDDISVGEELFYKVESGQTRVQLAWIGSGSTVPFERIYINLKDGVATGKMTVPEGFVHLQSQDNTINRLTIVRPGTILGNSIAQELMQAKIDELDEGSNLPSYYKEYLDGKEAEIRNLQLDMQGNEDSFIFITDTHWIDNYKQSPAIIESLLKRGLTNKVIFGGDLMGLHSDEDKSTVEETLEHIKTQIDFHRRFGDTVLGCGAKFFNVRGNHDINGYPAKKATLQSDNTIEMWRANPTATKNILLQPTQMLECVKNVNTFNYICDNVLKQMRYIFLDGEESYYKSYNNNVPDDNNIVYFGFGAYGGNTLEVIFDKFNTGAHSMKIYGRNNSESAWELVGTISIQDGIQQYTFSDRYPQIGYSFSDGVTEISLWAMIDGKYRTDHSWLAQSLNSTPQGYKVVVFCHYGAIPSTLSGFMFHVNDIIQGYNSKVSSCVVRNNNFNFSAASGKVIALISGHTHKDLQSFSGNVVHISTSCDVTYSESPYMNEKSHVRGNGSVTEQLFDFIQIDTDENAIYCKRIGAGYDRIFYAVPNTISVGGNVQLVSSLEGELEWGSYDNDQVVTKTDVTSVASSKISVSDGMVTGISVGQAVVYAKDAVGNREFFNVIVMS